MADLSALTGKPASDYAFGVMQFGGKADAAASRRLYDTTRDAGITIYDAAYLYTDGAAETLLGEFSQAERDDLILISKCGYARGMSGTEMKSQARESLKRLRTDYVDVLYLHNYPGDDGLDQALAAMRDLHADGAFRLLGVSNFAAWQVMKAQARAVALGAPPISVLQPMYNLVKRQAEVEILPMALTEGLVVHCYSPLGGGLLTGRYTGGGSGRLTENDMYSRRYSADLTSGAAEGLAGIAAEMGLHPATLAVAWVAHHPGISAPIISASDPAQIAVSLAAREVEMTDALYARLSSLTPMPPPPTDRSEDQGKGAS